MSCCEIVMVEMKPRQLVKFHFIVDRCNYNQLLTLIEAALHPSIPRGDEYTTEKMFPYACACGAP